MILLVLYGPPAAGKLTVARHLAEKTGFKLFHNHVSIDVAETFFERGTRGFNAVTHGIRKLIFEEAAKANLNLIFTVVYAYPIDNEDMGWMTRTIETWGGEVIFVQLTASKETLLKRVDTPSRKHYGKIADKDLLETILSQYDVLTPYPEREGLSFDTSTKEAKAIAQEIVVRLELTRLRSKSS
jgi:predicted kinase